MWSCKCVCGGTATADGYCLKSKNTQSCGCLQRERASKAKTIHGQSSQGRVSGTYYAWNAMKARCLNPKNISYPNYGGRGVKICRRWMNSFVNFLKDMGPKPRGLTLERINNKTGNYCPSNCKWDTQKNQCNNKRNSHFLTFNGDRKTIMQWAEHLGIKANTLYARINRHRWSVRKSLTFRFLRRSDSA